MNLKNEITKRYILSSAIILMMLTFTSCASMATFDQYAYAQTTSIKVDGLNIMDLAKEDFSTHKEAVAAFRTKLQKVYEYEKNRPKNEFTIGLWDKLLDPEGHLLGGFLKRWESENKLGAAFIRDEKKMVDRAFDMIAGLESKKLKQSDITKF